MVARGGRIAYSSSTTAGKGEEGQAQMVRSVAERVFPSARHVL
jgi:hypothetical protein